MEISFKKKASVFFENMKDLFSEKSLGKIYNVYATDYNRGNSKLPVFNAMLSIAERKKDEMERIECNLFEQCGFDIATWQLLEQDSKQFITEIFIEWIDSKDYSVREFEEAWDLIFSESQRYFEYSSNLMVIQWLAIHIPESHYPENIPLWEELSSDDQAEIGRPIKKVDIRIAVVKYHNDNYEGEYADEELAQSILDALDDKLGISEAYKDPKRTIKYWLNGN